MPGGITLVPKIELDPAPKLGTNLDANSYVIFGGQLLACENNVDHFFNNLPFRRFDVDTTPLLEPAVELGDWYVGDPWIIRANDRYYMFYYVHNYLSGSTTVSTCYATSDDLLTWTKSPRNPILAGSGSGWEGIEASRGAVIPVGATYHMYYEGGVTSTRKIGLATCGDLDNGTWTKYAGNPILSPGAEGGGGYTTIHLMDPAPYVFSGLYYLFYSGQCTDYVWRIFYATSPNGIDSWTKQGVAVNTSPGKFDAGWVAAGNIIRAGKYFVMIYNAGSLSPGGPHQRTAPSGVGLVWSADLTSWTKYEGNPIIATRASRGLANRILRGHLCNLDGEFKLFFSSTSYDDSWERIFSASPRMPSQFNQSVTIFVEDSDAASLHTNGHWTIGPDESGPDTGLIKWTTFGTSDPYRPVGVLIDTWDQGAPIRLGGSYIQFANEGGTSATPILPCSWWIPNVWIQKGYAENSGPLLLMTDTDGSELSYFDGDGNLTVKDSQNGNYYQIRVENGELIAVQA